MVGEDRAIMSVQELRRVHVIRQTMEQKLTQVKAGTLLGLTHQGRGTPSNRRIPDSCKAMALQLYEKRYPDFGPTLAVTSAGSVWLQASSWRRPVSATARPAYPPAPDGRRLARAYSTRAASPSPL